MKRNSIVKIIIISICLIKSNFSTAQIDTTFVSDSLSLTEISERNDTLSSIEFEKSYLHSAFLPKTKQQKINTALSFAIPSALITYGIITRFIQPLQKFDHFIDAKIKPNVHRKYTFDDYIQYAPYVAIFGLDWCKVRAKNGFWERTLVTATGALMLFSVITATKYLTLIERPDGSNFHSFPSGHTATAFFGAHILFREYQDVSPFIGIAGYAVALTTGAMRMVNRKHWLSDVVIGAGIGVLVAELSYLLLPSWRKLFKIKQRGSGLTIIPSISQTQIAICGVWIF
ncbi:MAG: phosphatase PAP2 family protein [Bacteroidales bacterium]|nr:phosphatase PAP2 family protein [Bacteroidales bacterium]